MKNVLRSILIVGGFWMSGDPIGAQTIATEGAGSAVASGQIGANPVLQVGTTIGFLDPSGFDELDLKCQIDYQADPTTQALAMDNLHVQITPYPTWAVTTGATLASSRSSEARWSESSLHREASANA